MTVSNATLKSLKKLLHAEDPSLVAQGAELAVSLDDDDLIATLLAGGRWEEGDSYNERWGRLVAPPVLFPATQTDANAMSAFMILLARSGAPAARSLCDAVKSLDLNFATVVDFSLLTGFTRLERLRITSANAVLHPEALATLSSLKELDFRWSYAISSLDGIASHSLQKLSVVSLTHIGAPGPLPALRELNLGHSPQLHDLRGLASITSLETFLCDDAPLVTDLSSFKRLSKLQTLTLMRAKTLQSLDGVEGCAALQTLMVTGAQVASIEPLRALTALESLDLSGSPVRSVEPLRAHPSLTLVNLTSTDVESVAALSDAKALRELRLSGTEVRAIEGARVAELSRFEFDDCRALESVAFLRGFSGLRSIHWANLPALRALDGIEASAPELTRVHVMGCDALADVTALLAATKLRELTLANARSLRSLAGVERCARLQNLSLTHAASLENLAPLAPLRELVSVNLFGAAALTDVSALAGASALQSLDLRDAAALTDISCLAKLTELSCVSLYGSGVTRGSVPRQLRDRCNWKVVPDQGVAMRAPRGAS